MCRKSELHWFYQDGASHIFPDAFAPYRDHIPEAERSDLIRAYYARLTSEDVNIRRAAAKEWTRWEMATSRLFPDPEYLDKAEDLDFAVAFARIECHYFINAIFVEEAYILKHVDLIQHLPTVIVQGDTMWSAHLAAHGNCIKPCPAAVWSWCPMQATPWAKSASPENWWPLRTRFVEIKTASSHASSSALSSVGLIGRNGLAMDGGLTSGEDMTEGTITLRSKSKSCKRRSPPKRPFAEAVCSL